MILFRNHEAPMRTLDADVERLKQQIAGMNLSELSTKAIVVDRVTKYYGRIMAVKGVSFFIDV